MAEDSCRSRPAPDYDAPRWDDPERAPWPSHDEARKARRGASCYSAACAYEQCQDCAGRTTSLDYRCACACHSSATA